MAKFYLDEKNVGDLMQLSLVNADNFDAASKERLLEIVHALKNEITGQADIMPFDEDPSMKPYNEPDCI
jgi:hypothetical protein